MLLVHVWNLFPASLLLLSATPTAQPASWGGGSVCQRPATGLFWHGMSDICPAGASCTPHNLVAWHRHWPESQYGTRMCNQAGWGGYLTGFLYGYFRVISVFPSLPSPRCHRHTLLMSPGVLFLFLNDTLTQYFTVLLSLDKRDGKTLRK